MQKNAPGSPRVQQIRRQMLRTASTPDLSKRTASDLMPTADRPTNSRSRSTMAPSDFVQTEKKRVRASLFPSQATETQKKNESENKDMELELSYNEYLQCMMMELIMKKKIENAKNKSIAQLATITKEREEDEEKLRKIKIRERDVIRLTNIQKEIDVLIKDANKHKCDEAYNTIKDILSQLHRIVEPLDVLTCENIVLPQNKEEWKNLEELFTDCATRLNKIQELIGTKREMYEAVNNRLKDFIQLHSDVENIQKKLKESLCMLQTLALKNSSISLAENDI